jgi:dinuclear metal center YbgI/SA1388 family protein
VHHLDQWLDIAAFQDKSLNGLQVEGAAEVSRITLTVDFCLASARGARLHRSQMLIVHHGLFWGEVEPITARRREQLRALFGGGVSLYAAHLPLDAHPEIGNNAQLANLLQLRDVEAFGEYRGRLIGCIGRLDAAATAQSLVRKVDRGLKTRTTLLPFGPARIRRLAIVSGDAAMLADQAADHNADALLTGEVSHTAYHVARERRIHLLCAGHYATETVGLKALAKRLEQSLDLQTRWLELPTGV